MSILPQHQVSAAGERWSSSAPFVEELSTITPVKKLAVSLLAVPKFHRPRPVPHALKPLVEHELDRLEKAGVLEGVDHSEWAVFIVTVPKRDRQVCICDDYKVTIKSILDVDHYPLLLPDDLFATLEYFSTLELSHAYNLLVLDDNTRQYMMINTHHGLYQYTQLPFGRLEHNIIMLAFSMLMLT